MLSINIPVYNIEVTALVFQLKEQAELLGIDFEIRVYDDGSDDFFKTRNKPLGQLERVIYTEMEQNLGRAAIRNRMGADSVYRLLLFIDADSMLIRNDYLATYLNHHDRDTVLCGGTAYDPGKPADQAKMLRWVYGKRREAVPADVRNSEKGFVITSNNFMIAKDTFIKTGFRENIKEYGHEDTLLGFDLYHAGVRVVHIDNPVEHTGLEDSGLFLEKTRKALKNLKMICEKMLGNDPVFVAQVGFLRRYKKITGIIPPFVWRQYYRFFHRKTEAHLKGKRPRLFWYDMYKLGYYASI